MHLIVKSHQDRWQCSLYCSQQLLCEPLCSGLTLELQNDQSSWAITGPLLQMCKLEVCILDWAVSAHRDKPVIRKALVELDGPVYGAYKKLRQRWATEDAYRCLHNSFLAVDNVCSRTQQR